MKNIINILQIILITISFSACSKDDTSNVPIDETKVNDNYYIKYEAYNGNGLSANGNVTTEKGILSFEDSFSETFGPVSKGFRASISVSCRHKGNGGNSTYSIRIYVSKNNEPFVLKASKEGKYSWNGGGNSLSANYIIDF